jgi:hypothetical protein
MMPGYDRHRISSLFFISFVVIGLFFLMNLVLSTVYTSYGEVTFTTIVLVFVKS